MSPEVRAEIRTAEARCEKARDDYHSALVRMSGAVHALLSRRGAVRKKILADEMKRVDDARDAWFAALDAARATFNKAAA